MHLSSYEFSQSEAFSNQFELTELMPRNGAQRQRNDEACMPIQLTKRRNSFQADSKSYKQTTVSLFPIQLWLIATISVGLDALIENLPFHNAFLIVMIHFFNFLFAFIVIIITQGEQKDNNWKIDNKKDHLISFLVLYKVIGFINNQNLASLFYHNIPVHLCSSASFYGIYFSEIYRPAFDKKKMRTLALVTLLLILRCNQGRGQALLLSLYYLSSESKATNVLIERSKVFKLQVYFNNSVSHYAPLLSTNSQSFQKYSYPKIFWLLFSLIVFITFISFQCLQNLHWMLIWAGAIIVGSSRFHSIQYLKNRYKVIFALSILILIGQWVLVELQGFEDTEKMKSQTSGFYFSNILALLVIQMFIYLEQLINDGSLMYSYLSTILLLPKANSKISKDQIYERSLNYVLISIRVVSFIFLIIIYMFNSYFTFFKNENIQLNLQNSYGFTAKEGLFLYSKQFGYFIFMLIPLSFYKFTCLLDHTKFTRGQSLSKFLKQMCYILLFFSFVLEGDFCGYWNSPLKIVKPWSEQMNNIYHLWYSLQRCQQRSTFQIFTVSHVLSIILLLNLNLRNIKQTLIPLFGNFGVIKIQNFTQKSYFLCCLLAYCSLFLNIYAYQCTQVYQWAILCLQTAVLIISCRIQ